MRRLHSVLMRHVARLRARDFARLLARVPRRADRALVHAVRQEVLAERGRWVLWLPVALGAGVGAYFAWPVEPPMWWGWAGAGALGAAAHVAARRGRLGAAFVTALVAFMALGFALSGVRTWWVAHPVLAAETGPVSLRGQVVALEPRPQGPRVTLERLRVSRLAPGDVPTRVRVSLRGTQPDMRPGDWLDMTASLSPPPAPAQPGAFDFQRQSYFRGLGAVGFAYGRAEVVDRDAGHGGTGVAFALATLRLDLAQRVRAHIPGDAGRVAAALMTGVRAAIPDAVMDAMRASGLAHLLAISGLHVGLIAGIVFFAVRLGLVAVPALALNRPVKKYAAVAGVAAALGYAVLAGFTVPTQRAFLMVALVLLGVMADRRALSMRSVAWAAAVILVLTPEALLGASFQLSFAAVVALVAVYETLRAKGVFTGRAAHVWGRIGRYVAGVALTTAVAGAATAAFAAFHFNRVADYGLAANLVAVPVMAMWIMPWAVAAFALMPLGLEGLALGPMGWGVEVVLHVAHTVAGWPGSQRIVPAFPVWGLALVALGGLWAAIWTRRWRYLGALAVVAGLSTIAWTVPPDVLIEPSGRLAAVRHGDGGYAVSTLRAKRFERDVWLRRAGLAAPNGRWRPADVTDTGAPRPGEVRCDALGCVYAHPGAHRATVAFVTAPEALREDCARARVVVNAAPTPRPEACSAPVWIGAAELARGGAHAVWFLPDGRVRVQSVNDRRGRRPWVVEGTLD